MDLELRSCRPVVPSISLQGRLDGYDSCFREGISWEFCRM